MADSRDIDSTAFELPAWERSEGFRETLLFYFTQPGDADVLRRLGVMLYNQALECSGSWPNWAESATRVEVRAAVADLRHLKGFLASVGREHEISSLTPEDASLSQLAAKQALEVDRILEILERGLE
jgi:hypothetical protein